jgi:hypothetical protein
VITIGLMWLSFALGFMTAALMSANGPDDEED